VPSDLAAGHSVAAGDVTDAGAVREAMRGQEGVVHLAALVEMWRKDRREFDRVNVGGLEKVLDAARSSGVSRVVYGSSFMALGPSDGAPLDESADPTRARFFNDYERTKYLADRLARLRAAGGDPLVVVYPTVVYGPGTLTAGSLVTRQVQLFLAGRLPGILGPGDRSISYAYVEDVARGIVLALERGRPGEGYILGGENATLNELLAVIARASGLPPPRRHIPYAAAYLAGLLQWWRAELTGRPPELTHQVVNIYKRSWAYDCSKARRDLGYTTTPLAEGMARTVRWLKESGLAG
jgi:farnesol dehydrogenase